VPPSLSRHRDGSPSQGADLWRRGRCCTVRGRDVTLRYRQTPSDRLVVLQPSSRLVFVLVFGRSPPLLRGAPPMVFIFTGCWLEPVQRDHPPGPGIADLNRDLVSKVFFPACSCPWPSSTRASSTSWCPRLPRRAPRVYGSTRYAVLVSPCGRSCHPPGQRHRM